VELIVVGLNHKTAPVEVRERLSFTKSTLPQALQQMRQLFDEGVILSTCNRTEIYTVIEDQQTGYTRLLDFLSSTHNTPREVFLPHLYCYPGEEAARHLFSVTSGIDSMIIGEPQILGQVREAFVRAQEAEAVGKYLSLLFRCALHAGKQVRSETRIAQGAASVTHATVEMARQMLGEFAGRHIVVIGAGEMGKLLTRCFTDAGCNHFTIISHNFVHAAELADTCEGAKAIELSALDEALVVADIALSSLDSPAPIIDYRRALQISQRRGGRPLYIVDLAVPRNVEATVRDIPGIKVFDIDDLQTVVQENIQLRLQEMEHIEAILEEDINNFNEQWRSTIVAPVITALRQRAEDIRLAELSKTIPKLQNLSDRELNIVEALTERIINKFLHEPVTGLRAKGDLEQAELVRNLFLLAPDEEEESV